MEIIISFIFGTLFGISLVMALIRELRDAEDEEL